MELIKAEEITKYAETQLTKVKPGAAFIKKVKAYSELEIAGIDDKDGAKKLRASRLEIREIRLEVSKKADELKKQVKDEAKSICDFIDSISDPLLELMKPVEDQLMDREKAWKEAVNKAKEEAERVFNLRCKALQEMGLLFNGSQYALGGVSIRLTTIKKLDEGEWELVVQRIEAEKDKIREAMGLTDDTETEKVAETKSEKKEPGKEMPTMPADPEPPSQPAKSDFLCGVMYKKENIKAQVGPYDNKIDLLKSINLLLDDTEVTTILITRQ